MSATATAMETVFGLAREAIEKREAHDEDCTAERSAIRLAKSSVGVTDPPAAAGAGPRAQKDFTEEVNSLIAVLKKKPGKTVCVGHWPTANNAFARKRALQKLGCAATTRQELPKGFAVYASVDE